GGPPGLLEEPAPRLGPGMVDEHHLEGQLAIELEVPDAIDPPHPAPGDLAEVLIAPQHPGLDRPDRTGFLGGGGDSRTDLSGPGMPEVDDGRFQPPAVLRLPVHAAGSVEKGADGGGGRSARPGITPGSPGM